MTPKSLRNRWTSELVEKIESVIVRNKSDGFKKKALPSSPFGFTNAGLHDFRGYPLHMFVSLVGRNADFSYARSPRNEYGIDTLIQIHGVELENISFVSGKEFHHLDGIFHRCDFSGLKGIGCHISGEFTDCKFENIDIRKSFFGAIFRNCSFESANLWHVTWPNCIFENCSLKGARIDEFWPIEFDRDRLETEIVSFRCPKNLVKP